jgi:serine/threonine protein phosphatase PrpC
VAVGHGRIFWGSFGDSRLYVAGEGLRRQINRTDSSFLGRSEEPDAGALATHMVCGELREASTMKKPFRLLLSTDGVPQSRGPAMPEWKAEEICRILAEAPDVSSASANLVAAALHRGGNDNICAIVAELKPFS